MSEIEVDKTFKVIILGDSQVGKTCILRRYVHGAYEQSTRATIGADFDSKILNVCDWIVNLNIWDTAGQDIYRSITTQYYRQVSGIVIVFDVAKRASFENLKQWLNNIKNNCDNNRVIKLLVGNKIDLPREVTAEEGSNFAMKNKLAYIETSAQNNINIDVAFREIAKIMLQQLPSPSPKKSEKSIILSSSHILKTPNSFKKKQKKASSCCCGRDYTT